MARLILVFDGNLQLLCRLYGMMTGVSRKLLSHRLYLKMGCDRIFLNVINIRNLHDENVNIHGKCITSPTLRLG